jgi:5-methylthioadenosine/S-adenosylhomocysteine deaminase
VREQEFPQQVVLSRSRYFAPATQSLRFYREYFQPVTEKEIEKDRLRFLVRFNDTEFFINLDTIDQPPLGSFLEIKSRTWSLKDAKQKSKCIYELLKTLDAPVDNAISQDYFEIAS